MPAPRNAPARQTSLRAHNLALVLAEVADRGPASRARIAAATGLTKATVSSLADTLLGAGLLAEMGRDGEAVVGRPGLALGPGPAGPVGIGLEINVDYLVTVTVDLVGTVLHRELVVEDFRDLGRAAALTRAAHVLRRAVDAACSAGRPVAGIAVAVPGLVEAGREVLRLAPNLGWRDVAVLEELRGLASLAAVPLRMDNEANFAALGELWTGGHGDLRTFVHVSGEIGVGAGLVVDGALFRGERGFSGEVGHLTVRPGGPRCRCGNVGCLEQMAGQEWILRRAGVQTRPSTAIGRPEGSVGELLALARSGDRRALGAIGSAGRSLGTGLAAVVNLVDVHTVVLGGLYAVLEPWLRGPVEEELARRVLSWPWAPVRVLVSDLAGEAAVRGASMAVIRSVVDDPATYLAAM